MEATELPHFIAKEFPYPRKSCQTGWGRIDYVDVGKGRPVLLLHGNPTWGFLYRKVIALLSSGPFRMIAPDLIGLGTSYKPKDWREHSLKKHGQSFVDFVEALDLKDIILVVQDWGGPIGAWMASQVPERVSALLLMNTSILYPQKFRTTPFHRFSRIPVASDLVFRLFRFPVPVMDRVQGNRSSISRSVKQAYYWPLRRFSDRSAPLALARMVPSHLEHPTVKELQKTDAWFRSFQGPTEYVWGMNDPILGRLLKRHREITPHARVTETAAGHFLQEEVPDEIAAAVRRLGGLQ